MSTIHAYQKQTLFGGWTRVEMLLQIYDRAIISLQSAQAALENRKSNDYASSILNAQKAVLAIHTGLRPDEHDVAFNIARLLHFALVSMEKRELEPAIQILQELRNGFAAVEQEVNELESQGKIPPIPSEDAFQSMA